MIDQIKFYAFHAVGETTFTLHEAKEPRSNFAADQGSHFVERMTRPVNEYELILHPK